MRKTLDQCVSELQQIRDSDIQRGEYIGFETLDEHGGTAGKPFISIRKGFPVYIAAMPHAGKSEWLFEMLINLSIFSNWRHCIYSGEEGSAAEIYIQLVEKYIGKPYRRFKQRGVLNGYAMTEIEAEQGRYWVSQHFYVLSDETDYTPSQFCKEVTAWEKELGFSFDTMAFDPFNDFVKDLKQYGNRIELWLEDELKRWRRECKLNNRAGFLVNHIAQIPAEKDKDTGKRFIPMPEPTEWAMGQNWYRRGFLMLTLWRPPFGMINPDSGFPYAQNEVIIAVHKAKPKGVACLGKKSMFWEWSKFRYYENIDGKLFFAGEGRKHLSELRDVVTEQARDLYGYASGRNLPHSQEQEDNPPF